jgi:hypothetical protein
LEQPTGPGIAATRAASLRADRGVLGGGRAILRAEQHGGELEAG